MVQRYSKNFNYVFNYRFLMFKIRDLSYFKPKITHFKHFRGKNSSFQAKKFGLLKKLSNFAHVNKHHKWRFVYY